MKYKRKKPSHQIKTRTTPKKKYEKKIERGPKTNKSNFFWLFPSWKQNGSMWFLW